MVGNDGTIQTEVDICIDIVQCGQDIINGENHSPSGVSIVRATLYGPVPALV